MAAKLKLALLAALFLSCALQAAGDRLERSKDLTLLARFVQASAGDQPLVCQVAVASVVLNRTESPFYPPSLAGVVYQEGAFFAVASGKLPDSPSRMARTAAYMAASGIDPSSGATKFWDPRKTVTNTRWQRRVTGVLGDYFFGE